MKLFEENVVGCEHVVYNIICQLREETEKSGVDSDDGWERVLVCGVRIEAEVVASLWEQSPLLFQVIRKFRII